MTRPLQQPVIEDKINKGCLYKSSEVGTFSITPERRVALYNIKNKRFCAEAPTEIGMNLAKLLKVAADAQDNTGKMAGLEALSKLNSSNSVLNRRSQGVQLFQSYAYLMCQMYMSETIDAKQFYSSQDAMLRLVVPMIEKEIPYLYRADVNLKKVLNLLIKWLRRKLKRRKRNKDETSYRM